MKEASRSNLRCRALPGAATVTTPTVPPCRPQPERSQPMAPFRLQREGGFTLSELLVAITILSIGLLAVASMQSVAMTNSSYSHRIVVATGLANQAMEDILAWDAGDARLHVTAENVVYADHLEVAGSGSFNISYATTVNAPVDGTTTVEVTVSDASTSGRSVHPINLACFRKIR